jgi:hypothetical protein
MTLILSNNTQGILLFLSILFVSIPLIAMPNDFTPDIKYVIMIIGAAGAALSHILGPKPSTNTGTTDPLANQVVL